MIINITWRYHFQDQQNNLIFRYDNTPHFPDLKSFPHHKHVKNKVEESDEPLILYVIKEAKLLAQ